MALMEAYGEGWDAYLRYADRLMAVDRADVKKAAAEILRLDRPVRIRLRSPASDSAA
jgi:predicted Zn-dependent peptidase